MMVIYCSRVHIYQYKQINVIAAWLRVVYKAEVSVLHGCIPSRLWCTAVPGLGVLSL